MHPKKISITDYKYNLPQEKIAKYPLAERDKSKLLIYENNKISEDIYCNLDVHLPQKTLLVFNDTKVIEARLFFQKVTGSIIELFCLESGDEYADITSAMMQRGKVLWKCLVGGAKKWKEEILIKRIETNKSFIELVAKKVKKQNDYFLLEFSWDDDTISFAEILHLSGSIPLPPYLERNAEEKDKQTYQTVYAKKDGSVASPTAGLHFTESLFTKFKKKNIAKDFVTLHVGAGTFKPVKSTTMQDHEMHAEFIEVRKELIENLLSNIYNNIICVGTTSLRTVESLYWMGVKLIEQLKIKSEGNIAIDELSIQQWDAYELLQNISADTAFSALLKWMNDNKTNRIITKTQILIAPPYALKVAKGLITNFHQPQSTLLLLVASIIGEDWRRVYNYALENNFRFLSYGDGCLIFKKKD